LEQLGTGVDYAPERSPRWRALHAAERAVSGLLDGTLSSFEARARVRDALRILDAG
jgi:hypothetical protein